jgi:hypothetical protein
MALLHIIDSKALFAAASIILGIIGFVPYLKSIFAGATKPHIFTWTIWSITMFIAFAAQLSAGAHLGAYHTGFLALSCIFICALALKYGEKNITRADVIYLSAALVAIPVWFITDTALYAVIIVLVVDMLGFLPTIRKSIAKPHEENAQYYFIETFSFGFAILAIESYSVTTTLYPLVLLIMNIIFPTFLILQRRRIAARI